MLARLAIVLENALLGISRVERASRTAAWWINEPPTTDAPVPLQSVDATAALSRLRALLPRLERAGRCRADPNGDADESRDEQRRPARPVALSARR